MDATIRVAEVPAGRGFAWLAEAFGLFRRKPAAWLALCLGWIVITFALILMPFIGGVLANFLQPAFFASFAIAAYRQSQGEAIGMGDLFAGFRRNLRALVNLGALLLLVEISIFALMALLGLPMSGADGGSFTVSEYLELLKGKEWILALGVLLTVVVKAAVWFAPPLIAFHGMSTLHAIRWSTYAALANLGAMCLYGVALFAIFFVGLIPWGIGLLVVIPLMVISTYIGYREVFESTEVAAAGDGKAGPAAS
ncbi:MAG: BPSS1780 family membrane protein [Usitatibacter sp.]